MSRSSNANDFYSEGLEEADETAAVKPERNLLAAVLSRAICDAFGTAHCERHIVRSARQWIFGKLTPNKPFSFAWVANNLDLNPVTLQESLRGYENNPEDIQDRLALLK
jgi:hypothetical protein